MTATYRQINAAARALQPVMTVRGLSGRTQLMLMRLWNELKPHLETLTAAETAAVHTIGGTVNPDGTIAFAKTDGAAQFIAQREEMLSVEIEIAPIRLADEAALFAETSPETWAALDGFIIFEGSEHA